MLIQLCNSSVGSLLWWGTWKKIRCHGLCGFRVVMGFQPLPGWILGDFRAPENFHWCLPKDNERSKGLDASSSPYKMLKVPQFCGKMHFFNKRRVYLGCPVPVDIFHHSYRGYTWLQPNLLKWNSVTSLVEPCWTLVPWLYHSCTLYHTTVDGCEILHQLVDGKHPIIYRVLTILLVVQDFATINHPQ